MTTLPVALLEYEPLARHTSWRIGGPARYYAEPRSLEAARALAAWAASAGLALIWLGGGTNLLVRDSGFPGVVARYRAQAWRIDEQGESATLHVEAGAPMAGTARRVGALGWAGLGWAEGVPGTIGGAVFGNAGCYGGDIAGLLQTALLLIADQVEPWPAACMGYAYRSSALKDGSAAGRRQAAEGQTPALILAAEMRLTRGDPAALAERMRQIAAERKRKTPWGSSCGSVFKNPPGTSAGRLIEQAGLKGHQIGGAEISERHANYIVNRGGASSDHVLALIDLARNEVQRQFGLELELEVRVIG